MKAIRITLGLVALALLVPHGCVGPEVAGEIGLARVYSGDEPHYLVLLNSVVRDGDLDVANNYRGMHRGDDQAGARFRGGSLDHHSAWIANGKYVSWPEVYEWYGTLWDKDADGHPLPKLRAGIDPSVAAVRETSMHWPGLAFLIAPLVVPFAGTRWVEPIAILCAWLALVLAMISFVSIARSFAAPPHVICIALVLTFLGTPIWHYSRALFSEPFALSCILGAYALLVARRPVVLAGILAGVCLLLKATYVVMLVPLGVSLLLRRQWKDAILFAAAPVLAVGLTMVINKATFGSYLRGPQEWLPGSFFAGALGLIVDPKHGVLLLAPIVVSALIGWPALLREHRQHAWIAAASVVAMYCLISPFERWEGGMCYGPRYLVPAIPLLMLGLLMRARTLPKWRHADLALLGAVSVLINFRAAVPYWKYMDAHPLAEWFSRT